LIENNKRCGDFEPWKDGFFFTKEKIFHFSQIRCNFFLNFPQSILSLKNMQKSLFNFVKIVENCSKIYLSNYRNQSVQNFFCRFSREKFFWIKIFFSFLKKWWGVSKQNSWFLDQKYVFFAIIQQIKKKCWQSKTLEIFFSKSSNSFRKQSILRSRIFFFRIWKISKNTGKKKFINFSRSLPISNWRNWISQVQFFQNSGDKLCFENPKFFQKEY